MFKIRTVVLSGLALILVFVLATVVYFKMATPAPSLSNSAANIVSVNPAQAPVSLNPSAYMSEQTLRRMLDQAYDHHWGPRGQALLSILNGRYEHRCCGLPR